jgi:hypothetical protein
MLTGNDLLIAVQNLPSMSNHIIPKVAYISLEYTLSVDEFLKMWEQFRLQETEGNPTQKDYDNWCLSTAKEYFYDMRGEIEHNIRLREDN